jgi:hypothetical protein
LAQRLERWTRRLQRCRRPGRDHVELALLGGLGPPEDGRRHVVAAVRAVGVGEPPGGRRLHGAHPNVDPSRREPGEKASLATDDGVEGEIVGDHGEDDPCAPSGFGR